MSDSATNRDTNMSIDQLQARLGRIEGQIRGIAKMLESGRACEDVVTQLMAVRSGIDTVGGLVLDVHLAQCIADGNHEQQLESLRDSLKLWWRFAPASGLSLVEGETSPWPRPV
jgi:CsoR family transcriptional regulator, copper-sensing transcriptional repressor